MGPYRVSPLDHRIIENAAGEVAADVYEGREVARIFAAGPELLAALKAMLALHIAHHNAPEHAAARAAIAKATEGSE